MGTAVRLIPYLLWASLAAAPIFLFDFGYFQPHVTGALCGVAIGLCVSQYITEEWWMDYEWVGSGGPAANFRDLFFSIPATLAQAAFIVPMTAAFGAMCGIAYRGFTKIAGFKVPPPGGISLAPASPEARYAMVVLLVGGLAGILALMIRWRRAPSAPVSTWFDVAFDEERVTMNARPPGQSAWSQSFAWADITRVCFKSEGPGASDGIYVFTSTRPESYVIPTEAKGGTELWAAMVERGLFPSELAIRAMTLPPGAMRCHPALED